MKKQIALILFLHCFFVVDGTSLTASQLCKNAGCSCKVANSGVFYQWDLLKTERGITLPRCIRNCGNDPSCASIHFHNRGHSSICISQKATPESNSTNGVVHYKIMHSGDVYYFEGITCGSTADDIAALAGFCSANEFLIKKEQFCVQEETCSAGQKKNMCFLDCPCSDGFFRRSEDNRCVTARQCDTLKNKIQSCNDATEHKVHDGEVRFEIACNTTSYPVKIGCSCKQGLYRLHNTCVTLDKCPSINTVQREKRGKKKNKKNNKGKNKGKKPKKDKARKSKGKKSKKVKKPKEQKSKKTSTTGTKMSEGVTCGKPTIQPKVKAARIVGGDQVVEHSWPWQVYLQNLGCGGSIISENIILTAAHCVVVNQHGKLTTTDIQVVAGTHDRGVPAEASAEYNNARGAKVKVKKIIAHDGFDFTDWNNDIALLLLQSSLSFDAFKSPVCLPEAKLTDVHTVVVTGWGLETNTTKGDASEKLNQVEVKTETDEDCKATVTSLLPGTNSSDSKICAGAQDKDSCKGDSGGPLVYYRNGKWEVQGIVSFGSWPCADGTAGVYTRVYDFIDWIKKSSEELIASSTS